MRTTVGFVSAAIYLVQVTLCQDSTPTSSLTETGPGKTVQTHVVTVGKAENKFVPNSLQANVGDLISFQFFPPNHSVGRAEYQQPCIPYEDTGLNKVGFFSGFFPLDKILPNPPTWNLTINDTEPIFLYCAAPGSCINFQMVAVINPNSSVSLATQKQDAAESQYMLAPGQPFPSEGGVPNGDVNPTSSTSSNTSSAPAASSSAPAKSNKLSSGAIAGIVVAAVVIFILASALFFLWGRHKTTMQFLKRGNNRDGYTQPNPQYPSSGPNYPPMEQQQRPSPAQHLAPFHSPSTYGQPSPAQMPYQDPNSYHDPNFVAAPPYAHPPQSPQPEMQMAELPSPGEKKSQEYMEIGAGVPAQAAEERGAPQGWEEHAPSPAPSPNPRPFSFWGRGRSQKTQTSELSADSPMVGRGGYPSRR